VISLEVTLTHSTMLSMHNKIQFNCILLQCKNSLISVLIHIILLPIKVTHPVLMYEAAEDKQ
jgi:hypothetical protein